MDDIMHQSEYQKDADLRQLRQHNLKNQIYIALIINQLNKPQI